MGVDTHVFLSPDVHVRHVAKVMGILAGLPKTRKNFNLSLDSPWTVEVIGQEVKPCRNVAELCEIHLHGHMIDGEDHHWAYYHFESDNSGKVSRHEKQLTFRSTSFWIAIGVGLVKFFGGDVDFYDTDDKYKDFVAPYPKIRNSPEDGKPWQDFQEKMFNLKPLTRSNLQGFRKHEIYKDAGVEKP